MAQIDALLSHMINTGTSRALLRGDAASQLENANGVSQGNVVSNETLEDTFLEIAPFAAQESMRVSGIADFQYNGFSFHTKLDNGRLSFDISSPASAFATNSHENSPVPSVTTAPEIPNDSGQGINSTLPPEAKGFNWGAFFLPWLWAIAHSTWIGLLSFIPVVGFFMRFFLGFKGNELGWKNRKFTSLEQFKNVQRTWLTAGAVVSALGCATFPITSAILFPVFARARENARRSSCQSNLKQLSLAILQSTYDNNEVYPKPTSDEDLKKLLSSYISTGAIEPFECPAETTKGTSDYVYNKQLAGMKVKDVTDPANTPMLWDKESINHLEGRNIAFADGHIKWYREADAQAWTAPYK